MQSGSFMDHSILVNTNKLNLMNSTPSTLAMKVYSEIHQDIRSGALPPEQHLKTDLLKDKYQTGTSPLREALARLASESFVTATGKSGYKVSPISTYDYEQLIGLRRYLEIKALKSSMTLGDIDWEAGILAAYHRMSKLTKLESEGELLYSEKKEELHRNYHFALLASCESWWELKIINNLTNHIERYRRVLGITLDASSSEYHKVQNEHHLLMTAVISKNFKEASSILDEHRKRTYKLIREKLETT